MKIASHCVLAIGGTDPSGGAGIQADIKAISATGSYAATVISALVCQNTQGVQAIKAISPRLFSQQIESIFDDLNISAVKIGMLYNKENIQVIYSLLEERKVENIILDPVFIAKNGSPLLKLKLIDLLVELFPKCYLITPNIYETEKLLDKRITSKEEQESAACELGKKFKTSFLVKGGHLDELQCSDFLFIYQQQKGYWFNADKITTKNTHGTGCSLSSAIASYLAQGYQLEKAIELAKDFLTQAIKAGSNHSFGKGNGPVDHFWMLRNNNP